jgi:HK97 family phage major capsid protein
MTSKELGSIVTDAVKAGLSGIDKGPAGADVSAVATGTDKNAGKDDNPFLSKNAKRLGVASRKYFEMEEKMPEDLSNDELSRMAMRMIGFIYRAYGNLDSAATSAEKQGCWLTSKALAASSLADGGAILPAEYAQGIIEELLPKSAVLGAGVPVIDMPTGTFVAPFIGSGTTATWVGESENITPSQPDFGQLQMSARKLATLTPSSNDLLRRSSPFGEQMLRNNVMGNMRKALDVTLIRGLGTESAPKGLRGHVIAANKFNANTTVSIANTRSDAADAIYRVEDNDVELMDARWIGNSRTKQYIRGATTTNETKAFPEMSENGSFEGYAFDTTSQIPSNLGGASTGSELYFWVPSSMLLGVTLNLTVELLKDAAYYNGSAVVSGASRDESVIRAIWEIDFAAQQRGKEIALIEDVRWGA